MYPTPLGLPFCIEETTLDANFTGAVERGRAKRTFGAGSSQVLIGAKLLGPEANSYSVALVDRGVTVSSTSVVQTGTSFDVILRRSSSAILATAAEVSVAINAANLPIRATAASGGAGVVVAAGSAALTGGLSPSYVDPTNTRFEWSRTTGQVGGFFYFENHQDVLVVTGVQAKFSGLGSTLPLRVAVINLDAGLEPIVGSDISVKDAEVSAAYPEFSLAGLDGIPLLPYQALLVTCAAVGKVRVTAQRMKRYPYQ